MARASWPTCTARSALALGVAVALGCTSRYQPQPGPRLSVVMDEGSLTYVRDGRRFKHGFAGSGLVEAVADDPQAKEAAETYRSRTTSGVAIYLVGTGCFITGAVAALSTIDARGNHRDPNALALGGLLCGLAGIVTGASLIVSGAPYQYDAVNIYNDNLEKRRSVLAPPIWSPGHVPPAPPPPPPPPPPPAAIDTGMHFGATTSGAGTQLGSTSDAGVPLEAGSPDGS